MASNQTGNFCRTCGAPFGPDTVFCGNCGTPLTNVEGKTASPSQQGANARSGMSGVNNARIGPQSGPNFNYTPPSGNLPAGGAGVDPNAPTFRQTIPVPTNVNNSMPPTGPISSGYLPNVPNVPPQGPQTPSSLQSSFYHFDQSPPPPPPQAPEKKSFWTPRKMLAFLAIFLLILLIAGGGLFVYAYQLGRNNQGNTSPTATSSTGQTSQTPTSVSGQATPDLTATAAASNSTPGVSASSTPATSLTPTATTVSVAATPGTVLYSSDFANEGSQWSGSSWSIVNGTLINDGSSYSAFITAPYQPTTRDYALVVTLEMPSNHCSDFFVVARATSDGAGDSAEYNTQQIRIATPGVNSDWYSYAAGTNKFTIRLEVKDITSKLFLNGSKSPLLTLSDTSRTDPGVVGLNVNSCEVQVFSFQVIAL